MNFNDCKRMAMIVDERKWLWMNGNDCEWMYTNDCERMEMIVNEGKLLWMNGVDCEWMNMIVNEWEWL